MVDNATADALHCANCGIPIIRTECMVEVAGRFYPCASCAWVAEHPELARGMGRGGGMVQSCALCQAPIVFSEIMVQQDGFTYCCPNNADVARLRSAARTADLTPAAG